MNRREATIVLLRQLARLRRESYDRLAARVGQDERQEMIRGRSGTEYQLEVLFVWDARPGRAVRVLGSIDDGGWQAYCPLRFTVLVPPPANSGDVDR